MKNSTASKVIIVPRPPAGGSTGSTSTKSNTAECPETVNKTSASTQADPVAEEPAKGVKKESSKEE